MLGISLSSSLGLQLAVKQSDLQVWLGLYKNVGHASLCHCFKYSLALEEEDVQFSSVQFSSVQDGIYALGKAHMRCMLPSLSVVSPNVALETGPMRV